MNLCASSSKISNNQTTIKFACVIYIGIRNLAVYFYQFFGNNFDMMLLLQITIMLQIIFWDFVFIEFIEVEIYLTS